MPQGIVISFDALRGGFKQLRQGDTPLLAMASSNQLLTHPWGI
jgi:hypothetical protein